MKVQIKHNQKTVSDNILVANNIATRVIGLMFRKKPMDSDGMLLEPCNSIHTFFMRYPLDVVFLSKTNEVVKVIRGLKPWRATMIYLKARKTLELPAGKLPSDVTVGDILEVRNV